MTSIEIIVKQNRRNTPMYNEHHMFDSIEDARAFVKDLNRCGMRFEHCFFSEFSHNMVYVFETKHSISLQDIFSGYQHQWVYTSKEDGSKTLWYKGMPYEA